MDSDGTRDEGEGEEEEEEEEEEDVVELLAAKTVIGVLAMMSPGTYSHKSSLSCV